MEIEGKTVDIFCQKGDISEKDFKVDILFVGEAPGIEEEREGRPFVGKAGKILRNTISQLINELNLSKIKIGITNSCKCRPFDFKNTFKVRAPTKQEIEACNPNLKKDIELTNPEVIIALGKTAATALKIKEGKNLKLKELRGNFWDTPFGKVFVTYHPSAILRTNWDILKIFQNDLKRVFEIFK